MTIKRLGFLLIRYGIGCGWQKFILHQDQDNWQQVFPLVETALERFSPIEIRYRLPRPTWHGHDQAFYHLRDTSPFLLINFVVQHHSIPNKLLEWEIHGRNLDIQHKKRLFGSRFLC